MRDTLRTLRTRVEGQTDEVVALVQSLDDATFSRRPAQGRWSVGEHLAHLCQTLRPYADAMEASVERARRKGWRPDGSPPEGTWLGRKFHETLEPPPKKRVKTFGGMRPPPTGSVERGPTLDAFRVCQARLLEVLDQGDEVDLARARIASPFVPVLRFVRFPVFQSVGHMAAHTDRHLWLMREALEQMEAGAR